MKVCRSLWSAGIPLDLGECRKWLFDIDGEPQRTGELISKIGEEWKQIVVLNQLLHASKDFGELESVLEKVLDEPLLFVINLRKYYPEVQDPNVIVEIPRKKAPEYLSTTENALDFFLNYLKFEEGVDVDGLVEPLRKLLGKDDLVGEFLRLCDIDGMGKVEEFMERVEKGVDVLIKAKDQGLDLEDVLKRWDELANGGGERFVYLEKAVKEVADEEVSRKFWEAVEKAFEENGVKVSGIGSSEPVHLLFYSGLINVQGLEVDTEPMKDLISKISTFLKRIRPVPIFTAQEVEKVLSMVGLGTAVEREQVERAVDILSSLDRFSAKVLFDEGIDLFSLASSTDEDLSSFVEKVSKAVKDAKREGMEGSELVEYIKKALR